MEQPEAQLPTHDNPPYSRSAQQEPSFAVQSRLSQIEHLQNNLSNVTLGTPRSSTSFAATSNRRASTRNSSQSFRRQNPAIPTQKIFLKSYLTHPLATKTPPSTLACPFCRAPFYLRNKTNQAVQIQRCSHYVHYECLIDHFRSRDSSVGLCPQCGDVVCTRSLAERLDTDREAIFGVGGFKSLDGVVEVFIPHTAQNGGVEIGDTILCASEEEVGTVLMRVLKFDVSQSLAGELQRWRSEGGEVSWGNITTSASRRFRSRGFPLLELRFVVDDDIFFNFLVFSEILRALYSERAEAGADVEWELAKRDLERLRSRLRLAKEVFDRQIWVWGEQNDVRTRGRYIAKDAHSIAMKTLASAGR
ncbi:unnamed protein product [Periconia digitata]|uniref:RING-type domain-containing protein n=1 Tax=Periconia digitata TaxID=1303443 RepID=A0A9W4UGN8_9PLEO|nr:unnamed protein product [Periconia digitata]